MGGACASARLTEASAMGKGKSKGGRGNRTVGTGTAPLAGTTTGRIIWSAGKNVARADRVRPRTTVPTKFLSADQYQEQERLWRARGWPQSHGRTGAMAVGIESRAAIPAAGSLGAVGVAISPGSARGAGGVSTRDRRTQSPGSSGRSAARERSMWNMETDVPEREAPAAGWEHECQYWYWCWYWCWYHVPMRTMLRVCASLCLCVCVCASLRYVQK